MKNKRIWNKLIKGTKGAISIFLSLLLTGVCSLTALVMEGNRYKVAQQVLDEATITTALSQLAGLDSTLQKRFGLYGVKSKDGKASNVNEILKKNSDASANGISLLYNLSNSNASFHYDLANYSVLERQILEHEKYRAPLEMLEEFIDIDKIISDIIKKIRELIPMLDNILDICDAIADILEGLKAIYSLAKTIQQLESSTVGGAPGFNNEFADIVTAGWGSIEKLINDEGWDNIVADPSYYTSHNNLSNAINAKIDYLKAHKPAPTPPSGECPTVNYGNKSNADKLYHIASALEKAIKMDYFDDNGIVDGDISELFKKLSSNEKNDLSLTNSNKNISREDFISRISERINSFGLSIEENPTKTDAKTAKENIEGKAASFKSIYNSQSRQKQAWEDQNKKYQDYQAKIKELNEAIDSSKNNLSSALGKIGTLLGTYKTNFEKATTALEKAINAGKKMKDATEKIKEKSGDWSDPDVSKVDLGPLDMLYEELKRVGTIPADAGLVFVAEQKGELEKLNGVDINENFGSLTSHSEYRTGLMANYDTTSPRYYLTKAQMTEFLAAIAGINVVKTMNSQLVQTISIFKQLFSAFSPLPAAYELDCKVNLNSSTMGILPSRTGTNSEGDIDVSDINAVRSYLNDARTLLGSVYDSDIGLVSPDKDTGSDMLNEELTERIANVSENCQKLTRSQNDGELIVGTVFPLISAVVRIVSSIPTIVSIVTDVTFIANHIVDVLKMLPSMLGESVLINQFAITKFSNRLDKVKGESGIGKSLNGSAGNIPAQTFSQANLEYIVAGDSSEVNNQKYCFSMIMGLRMLNNALLIFKDPNWMELIGACNVFGPLVFILLMYYESNIDMNLLIRLKMKVPLIKTNLVLSLQSTEVEAFGTLERSSEEISVIATDDSISITSSYTQETWYYYESWTEYEIGLEDKGGHISNIENDLEIMGDGNSSQLKQFYAQNDISGETKKMLESLEDGILKLEYRYYLFLFMILQSNRLKVKRMADLIQLELRYKEYLKGGMPQTLLEDYHTFIKVDAKASLNSILPVFSLGSDGKKKTGWGMKSIKYVGY